MHLVLQLFEELGQGHLRIFCEILKLVIDLFSRRSSIFFLPLKTILFLVFICYRFQFGSLVNSFCSLTSLLIFAFPPYPFIRKPRTDCANGYIVCMFNVHVRMLILMLPLFSFVTRSLVYLQTLIPSKSKQPKLS